MREIVFINYANGHHRNDTEQQSCISAHSAKLKQSKRKVLGSKRCLNEVPDATNKNVLGSPRRKHRSPIHNLSNAEELLAEEDVIINSIKFDPYDKLAYMNIPEHRRIADYVIRHYARRIQPLQRATGTAKTSAEKNFAMALMSPELFYAIMAMGCADYEMRMTHMIPEKPSQRVLLFKGLALQTLSSKLQHHFEDVDMAAVLAIVMLMGLDIAFQDFQPVMIHRRALRQLIALPHVPGLPASGAFLTHENLSSFTDSFLSEEEPAWNIDPTEDMLFPYSSDQHQPLRYPSAAELATVLPKIPAGIRNVALDGALSMELLEIMMRVTQLTTILHKGQRRDEPLTSAETAYVLAYRAEHEFHNCIDCLRRISLRERPEAATIANPGSIVIEHVVCLALLLLCNCEFGCMLHGPIFKKTHDAFRVAVEQCPVKLGQEDCMIWAQSIGLWAAVLTTGEKGQDAEFYITRFRRGYTKHLCLEEYKDVLKKFLWTELMMRFCERSFERFVVAPTDSKT
ncbi:hypothetical protein PV08_01306 [Exophiala spinifera]|uniref:Transcription factor domain-containing protein n=1 Tax=Exophiala spinifera TaxID=91928 RepID=A0A0D2BP74_9EURO|nr:uncharacterized protein PV08_01306 [Exophiala spinifera]KIW20728.1 hypothetical protein PV08_01306 [Exophiala spinifera]